MPIRHAGKNRMVVAAALGMILGWGGTASATLITFNFARNVNAVGSPIIFLSSEDPKNCATPEEKKQAKQDLDDLGSLTQGAKEHGKSWIGSILGGLASLFIPGADIAADVAVDAHTSKENMTKQMGANAILQLPDCAPSASLGGAKSGL